MGGRHLPAITTARTTAGRLRWSHRETIQLYGGYAQAVALLGIQREGPTLLDP